MIKSILTTYLLIFLVLIGCNNKVIIMKNGLIIEDKLIGEGNVAEQYSIVTVHYSGRLQSGKYFDSTNEIGREPFRFTLGAGQVIKGWDQGLIGMKVGGKRKLTIPPSLGYEDRDMGVIPPNSTLIFVIELIEVE
ncbi:FKBP-type peptidyl-prolyl cis-trans isomerase [Candidatus Marinimicrobia bacterium]|nr:FKBP-type peptidyl-prolyl cis-trans isomerase [Candidatus Neomarinimicrobiota bacterium]|tara:strand:- start:738 stop:1142 length:405 start_codon:yes stop_codon:yes gene_type:complete